MNDDQVRNELARLQAKQARIAELARLHNDLMQSQPKRVRKWSRVFNHLRNNVIFHTNKERRKILPARIAADILQAENFSIDCDLQDPDFKNEGYGTLWRMLAYHHPYDNQLMPMNTRDISNRIRFERCQQTGEMLRYGFTYLRYQVAQLIKRVLFMVPRSVSGTRIEVITIFPNKIVNDETGETARDIYKARREKRIEQSGLHFAEDEAYAR